VNAYLVRLKANAELVGLFVAPSLGQLTELIDECCPPRDCEYLLLRNGGIYLHQAGAAKVPTSIDSESDDPGPDWFSGATVSELWLDIFYRGGDGLKWKAVNTEEMDPWLRAFE
jgi:hypothetical protein